MLMIEVLELTVRVIIMTREPNISTGPLLNHWDVVKA
jgi:hypothetical protein